MSTALDSYPIIPGNALGALQKALRLFGDSALDRAP